MPPGKGPPKPPKPTDFNSFTQYIHSVRGQEFNRRFNEHMNAPGAPPGRPMGKALEEAAAFDTIRRLQGGVSANQIQADLKQVRSRNNRRGSTRTSAKKRKKIELAEGEDKIAERDELLTTFARAQDRVRAAGEEPKGDGGGGNIFQRGANFLGNVVDVVSRPNYAVAEATREFLTSGSPKEALGGAWSGFSGQDKTSFIDVVEAMKNEEDQGRGWFATPLLKGISQVPEEADINIGGWRAKGRHLHTGAGLAADIATDPTTWFSLGSVGAARNTVRGAMREGIERATRELTEQAVQRGVTAVPRLTVQEGQKAFDDLFVEFRGGAARGRNTIDLVDTPEGPQSAFVEAVSNRAAQAYVDRQRSTLADYLAKVASNTPRRKPPEIYDVYNRGTYAAARINQGNPNLNTIMAKAGEDAVEDFLQSGARTIQRNIADSMMTTAQRGKRLSLRMGWMGQGSDLADYSRNVESVLKGVYDTGKTVTRPLRRSQLGQFAGKVFSYKEHFPGLTSSLRQRVLSQGVRQFDNWQRSLLKDIRATGASHTQLENITDAIEGGYKVVGNTRNGTPLADVQQRIMDEYKLIWDEEKAFFRDPGNMAADNYTYMWLKRGTLKERQKFREARKVAINQQGTVPSDYGSAAAAAKGLRPEKNALKNLIFRKGDSQRKFVRQWFSQEILNKYGIRAQRGIDARSRGLVGVRSKIPRPMKDMLGKNEQWYMPKELEKVFDEFDQLMRTGDPNELNKALRVLDAMTRYFKFWNTVPWPGFHIRNLMGDTFLAWLDGTTPGDFADMTRALAKARATGDATVSIAGQPVSFAKLREMYLASSRASLFYHSGVGMNEFAKMGSITDLARRGSEWREDYVRFIHYKSALNDEMAKRVGKDVRPTDIRWRNAWKEASIAAQERVNKFNFDYSALTAIETRLMKRVIPFYTFTRKAIPLMFESMLTNPGKLSLVGKTTNFIEEMLGVEGTGMEEITFPDYIQDPGYIQLNDEEEPDVFTLQGLPMSQVSQLLTADNPQELGRNFANMLNPYIKAPMEWLTGTNTFTGARSDRNLFETVMSNFRPVTTYQRIRDDTSPAGENFIRDIMGFDKRTVTADQQISTIKGHQRELNEQLGDINARLEEHGLDIRSISRGEKRVWRLYLFDDELGQYVAVKEFNSSSEAQTEAEKMMDRIDMKNSVGS